MFYLVAEIFNDSLNLGATHLFATKKQAEDSAVNLALQQAEGMKFPTEASIRKEIKKNNIYVDPNGEWSVVVKGVAVP